MRKLITTAAVLASLSGCAVPMICGPTQSDGYTRCDPVAYSQPAPAVSYVPPPGPGYAPAYPPHQSLFELLISKSYTNAAVSILLSVEVLSRKAPVRCLPNACLRRGGALLSPNLFYQPIEIAYSNRLSAVCAAPSA
jgi:hypothetical protein